MTSKSLYQVQRSGNLAGFILGVFVLSWGTVHAADRFSDWRDGDLVFQESTSSQSNAIRAATGSRYTHMGIVRLTRNGPRVIEAARTVSETPLPAFLRRGRDGDYAVYRVKGLTQVQASAVLGAARRYYGRPYDVFFRPDPDAIYCSELPHNAFRTIGISLGRVERFGDLAVGKPEVRTLFLARRQAHPDCRAARADANQCWSLMQEQRIVTPASIAEDPGVELVFSTFDPS